jgi:hypothetical protein
MNIKLVKEVGKLLACEDACHPDFFSNLAAELAKRGYNLEARQGGINGTYLKLEQRRED